MTVLYGCLAVFGDEDVSGSGNAPVHRLASFGEVDRRIDHADGLGMNRLGHDDSHAPAGPDSFVLRLLPRLFCGSVSQALQRLGDGIMFLAGMLIAYCGDSHWARVLGGRFEQLRAAHVSYAADGFKGYALLGLDGE